MSKSRTILIVITVASAYTIWGITGSLLPPFFPTEAESKGADTSQSGFVFGIYSLVGFISSPLFGKYGSKFSPGLLYNPSAFVLSACTLAFGYLSYIEDLTLFLSLAYILRIISGIANAAAWGSLFASLITLFPNHVSKIVAASELFYGIGYMLGPAIGGLLYNTGGFVVPFEITGSIALLVSILMLVGIPKVNVMPKNEKNGQQIGSFQLMRIPSVIVPLMDTFVNVFGFSMSEAMIGLYLTSNGADTTLISSAFFLCGGCYMISTVVSGYITDKFSCPTVLSILGNMGLVFAFIIMGPLPFIPMNGSVTMIMVSMAFEGFSLGLVYVSSFTRAQNAAKRNGFPEDTKSYHLISSMWVSFDLMGSFFGPCIGGIVAEMWDFRTTTVICWMGYLIMLVIDVIEFYYQKNHNEPFNTVKYTEIKVQN